MPSPAAATMFAELLTTTSPLMNLELLQWLALDARHNPRNEPARKAHLDHGDQRAIRFERREGSAQVVQLLHGGTPSVHINVDGCNILADARPIASSLKAFGRRPRCKPHRCDRPASETLNKSGHSWKSVFDPTATSNLINAEAG